MRNRLWGNLRRLDEVGASNLVFIWILECNVKFVTVDFSCLKVDETVELNINEGLKNHGLSYDN